MDIKEAIIRSELPKLDVNIGIFEHKETKEIRFCVMGVNTRLTKSQHMYVFNASEWKKLDSKLLEGTERIQESFHTDILKQMEIKPVTKLSIKSNGKE